MSDNTKSISELMDMMKQDSDSFFGKIPEPIIGYCKYCQVEIFDEGQDCDCAPRPPNVQKSLTLGNSANISDNVPSGEYNDAIAKIEDEPEGGWDAIVARQKMGRKPFVEGADPVEKDHISIHDPDYQRGES